ncbi:TldD/PmbA family protein [Candidatus Margulisiibacteriota bacterium]
MSDQELAAQIIKRSLSSGADLAEVFISKENSLNIEVINQKLESSDNIESGGIGLRIIKDHKLGFSYITGSDEDSLSELINSAIANSKNTVQDNILAFPESALQPKEVNIYDKEAEKVPFKEKLGLALQMEKAAYGCSKKIKKTEKVIYNESVVDITIANSKGIKNSYKKSFFGGYIDVIAEEKGLMESGHWSKFSSKYANIDPLMIGQTAAKRAAELLGAKRIKSQKMTVVLAPHTASMILEALSPTLSAGSVLKGRSLFAGKMERKVASKKISIIDNGTLEYGLGSTPCDGEGHPTQETSLINSGVLTSFMFDHYNAKKMGKDSTGNAVRGSFKSTPEIAPTNLYIKNGTANDLRSGVKHGLLVDNIIGAHTINPISGDFSIGAVGYLIENGQLAQPVRGITIAGNLIELLNKVEEIGSDLEFFSNVGSPSILIPEVSVSGE